MMNNIRIINVENGGFIIHADDGKDWHLKPIAALSNSDDLIDWLIKQFNLPAKNADEMIAALEAISPEPEQAGFITKEPEWIEWSGGLLPVGPDCPVEVHFKGGTFDAMNARFFFWEHKGAVTDIVRYRALS